MFRRKEITRTVEGICEEVLPELGLELVDVEFNKESGRNILRIVIYRPTGVTLEDCEAVSNRLGQRLDEVDPINVPYSLEVSSPGIDRRLKSDREYRVFQGQRVRVSTFSPLEGAKVHFGLLVGSNEESITIRTEKDEQVIIPKDIIAKASLNGSKIH